MSATLVASLMTAEAVDSTLSQTDGRDKVLRLIQYVCKLLQYVDGGKNSDTTGYAGKAAALESALSASRQAWRLFKWASVYAKGRQRVSLLVSSATSRTIFDVLASVTDLSLLAYYMTDNAAFAAKLGVLPVEARLLGRRAARFWLLAVVAGFSASSLRLRMLRARACALRSALRSHEKAALSRVAEDAEADGDRRDREGTVECLDGPQNGSEDSTDITEQLSEVRAHQGTTMLTAVRQACDVAVAGSGAFDTTINPGLVGLCGTVSSLIGLIQLWPKAANPRLPPVA